MTDARYTKMVAAGADAAAVYRAAKADGLGFAPCIKLLRELFNLGLGDAKEIVLVADGEASSREAYEERYVDAVDAALKE